MTQDRSNIRSFYLRQREALVRFLTQRTRDPALAEDLAQETWIRVSQAGGAVAIENPQAYLFRIASNLVTDHTRAVARRRLTRGEIDEILQIPEDEPDPEKITIDRSELQRVLGLLQDLPDRQRQILLMSRLERLPHHAIARQFGISTRTVEFELTRALTACRPSPKK
ncbi:RNA polymerase sigma-70 factor (ECF subfamily) [Pseudorhodoplanes sinuspersici]|nr:RNA polymerase sigma-70 factor (ECF subfamily) [Pseudorhodoplanes sinuspersici]